MGWGGLQQGTSGRGTPSSLYPQGQSPALGKVPEKQGVIHCYLLAWFPQHLASNIRFPTSVFLANSITLGGAHLRGVSARKCWTLVSPLRGHISLIMANALRTSVLSRRDMKCCLTALWLKVRPDPVGSGHALSEEGWADCMWTEWPLVT